MKKVVKCPVCKREFMQTQPGQIYDRSECYRQVYPEMASILEREKQ